MKINKITLLVCSILTVVSGLTMVVIESTVPDISVDVTMQTVDGWTFWPWKPAGPSATWDRMAGKFRLRLLLSQMTQIC